MKLIVSKKSAITKNGNAILSLKSPETLLVKTPFGMKKQSKFYLMAVDFEGSANVGDEADININDYKVEERPIVNGESGEVTNLSWISLK